MTDEQIIEKLATEVMGWKLDEGEDDYGQSQLFWYDNSDEIRQDESWNPLEDMNDAWMVVEKLWEEGISLWVGPDPIKGGYAVQCKPVERNVHDFIRAETATYAICIAALRAKGLWVDAE